jgi:hypothetical protein
MAERGAAPPPTRLALRPLRSIVVVLVTLLAAAPVVAAPRRASGAQTRSGTIDLHQQTTWWQPGQAFAVSLAVDAPDPGVEVAISVYSKLPTRTDFAASAEGRTTGRPVQLHTVPLEDVAADPQGHRVVTFEPTVRVDGVYPMRVELRPRGGGEPFDEFVTHLVVVPPELRGDELAVATILPVHAPPAVRPDGEVAIDDRRAARLADLTEALATGGAPALTLLPTPETVEALAASPRREDAGTLAAMAAALASGSELLGSHYVPTNQTSMTAAGLEEEAAGQLTRGTDVLRSEFGAEPVTATRVIDERLSPEAITHLRTAQGVTRMVIPESLLEPVARNTTLTATFLLDGGDEPLAAAMADAALAAHAGERDPVLGAQHLLADLAQLYNDEPPTRRRGVVVSFPRSRQLSPAFLETFLRGLTESPILVPTTADGFFEAVDQAMTGPRARAAPLVRRIGDAAPDAPSAPALPGSAIREVRRDIDAFASAVDPASEAGRAVLDRFDRTLLTVPSIDLRVRERLDYLDGLRAQIAEQVAAIAMPQNRSITLTAREGDIPITITSDLGYPVRVLLRVSGRPLEFPGGDVHELELRRDNTTSRFTVQAPSSGSFPIRVELVTPEGDLQLAESRFTVRSTAISGVGTALSIGAALFLILWWGNHLRGRRSKRLVPA